MNVKTAVTFGLELIIILKDETSVCVLIVEELERLVYGKKHTK